MKQAPKPGYVTIPDPSLDVQGLYRTVVALKQTVEMIIGTRGGPTVEGERKVTTFIQASAPTVMQDGDFWFCNTGEFTSLSIASKGTWLLVWPAP